MIYFLISGMLINGFRIQVTAYIRFIIWVIHISYHKYLYILLHQGSVYTNNIFVYTNNFLYPENVHEILGYLFIFRN